MSVARVEERVATHTRSVNLAPDTVLQMEAVNDNNNDNEPNGCGYADLKEMTVGSLDDLEEMLDWNYGFRHSTRLNKMIPASYDSTSQSARNNNFYDTKSSSPESVQPECIDDSAEKDDTKAEGKRLRGENDTDLEEEENDGPPRKVAFWSTRCGMVPGSQWDGNGQCQCAFCMGDFDDVDEVQDAWANAQEILVA